jgi:hypothetical protein
VYDMFPNFILYGGTWVLYECASLLLIGVLCFGGLCFRTFCAGLVGSVLVSSRSMLLRIGVLFVALFPGFC